MLHFGSTTSQTLLLLTYHFYDSLCTFTVVLRWLCFLGDCWTLQWHANCYGSAKAVKERGQYPPRCRKSRFSCKCAAVDPARRTWQLAVPRKLCALAGRTHETLDTDTVRTFPSDDTFGA